MSAHPCAWALACRRLKNMVDAKGVTADKKVRTSSGTHFRNSFALHTILSTTLVRPQSPLTQLDHMLKARLPLPPPLSPGHPLTYLHHTTPHNTTLGAAPLPAVIRAF